MTKRIAPFTAPGTGNQAESDVYFFTAADKATPVQVMHRAGGSAVKWVQADSSGMVSADSAPLFVADTVSTVYAATKTGRTLGTAVQLTLVSDLSGQPGSDDSPFLTKTDAIASYLSLLPQGQTQREVRSTVLPTVMASPPTVTLGGVGAASGITSAQTLPYNTSLVRILGGVPVHVAQFGSDYYANGLCAGGTLTPGTPGGGYQEAPMTVEFGHDGSKLEIQMKTQSGSGIYYRVSVDGQYVAASPVAPTMAGGSHYNLLIDFAGVHRPRRISVELLKIHFGGLNIGANDTVWVPDYQPVPYKVVWLGDSVSQGVGATTPLQGCAFTACRLLGWSNVYMAAEGGTGYLNNAAGASGAQTFANRLSADVLAQAPDTVVVWGGINDTTDNGFSNGQLQTAVTSLLSALKAGLPAKARIIVIGTWTPTGGAYAPINNSSATIAAAAAAADLTFIDTTGWITGTGNSGSTTGSGNGDLYVSSDGTHPSQAGHDYVARRIAGAVAATLTA